MEEIFREFIRQNADKVRQLLKDIEAEEVSKTFTTGYEKVSKNEPYYWVNVISKVAQGEGGDGREDNLYLAANYYNSNELAERMAFEESLLRRLRKFAAEEAQCPMTVDSWQDGCVYIIYYNGEALSVDMLTSTKAVGDIIFNSREAALKAIDLFYEELMYYFTGE